ncbi:transglycosylase domain-containing protein [Streptomyces sp. H27-C3]|nr:transglycosylase domain-containing protein [Streptomyces sp. H27-C3]MDJ0463919.1 transglycosylase domain-containing protein [Streptomyces sp. H27-C3]
MFSDSTRLARTGEVNRENVPLDRVPKDVQRAFVAAENRGFYSDSGISLTGTARGIASTVTGQGKQGGSTITHQYVKNYYLSQEQTVSRKVKELVISLKVDRHDSKDDILAGYLNTSYYGRLAYGVQAAARAYYNVDVEDLAVEQGAYLAALLQAPSQYDWAVAAPAGKRLVKARWGYVLDNMVEEGWLEHGERERMTFPEPAAPKPGAGLSGQTGYLVDTARRELVDAGVSEQELAGGGWKITLHVDPAKQRALERAVTKGLAAGGRSPKSGARKPDPDRQAGAVSMDPRNGRILALYGGRDYFRHYLNNATRSDYQAGVTFEPVALATSAEGKVNGKYDVGPAAVRRTAESLGMRTDPSGFASPQATSLGLMGAAPLEMAGVYASFSNEGKKVTPSIVKSAQRGDERTRLPKAVGGPAISPPAAELINSLLATSLTRDMENRAFVVPPRASESGRAVTGTSGPSDDGKAEWFIGGTPDLITSIGLFGEDAKSQKQVPLKNLGDGHPSRIWALYAEAVSGGPPAGVGSVPGR